MDHAAIRSKPNVMMKFWREKILGLEVLANMILLSLLESKSFGGEDSCALKVVPDFVITFV